ncbi:phytanoyl-dioxygenase family protein [Diplodia corticola]|uniref:Phytanoyl-dioxygenase family protein n=1 Tax=Diplodia corticola TaxID=236234 RepID=A0A1J9RY11_9PEZI|nr:phytanoyl-dioxygenase family protein [Diplodia corticola]OJD37539.1 phytanoyl-dioxygenase family protein [Diplodia corticola]
MTSTSFSLSLRHVCHHNHSTFKSSFTLGLPQLIVRTITDLENVGIGWEKGAVVEPCKEYGPEVQKVPATTPLDHVLYLLKRDGGVFIKGLIPTEDVDKAYDEVRETLDNDVEWDGNFFPKETQRASALIMRSPTYVKTQLMNPLYQQVIRHFLTTRSWFWWGDERKESVSKPQVHSCVAMRIGPGATAQPLHRDDYISHNMHDEVDAWDDERDKHRESAVGMFVAGSRVTKENGGTAFIPRSHLWGNDRKTPPRVDQCIFADMEKGDAFIMLASAFHGGGNNTTKDEKRLVFSTFSVRGYLRQEENQFLAVSQEAARRYDRSVQDFMGYSMSEPAGGWVEQMDPIYALRPELKEVCKRCTLKGLHCEGYPPRFQFLEYGGGALPSTASGPRAQPDLLTQQTPSQNRKESAQHLSIQDRLGSVTLGDLPDCPLITPESSLSPKSETPFERASLVDDVLSTSHAQRLLVHFDTVLCDKLAIATTGTLNPFRAYVLPLSYQHTGTLHALLGLTAYHLESSGVDTTKANSTAALQHKLSAIQSLSGLLLKEEISGLSEREEEVALVMVLLLVLQDVCESGISTHGAHITGVTFLCRRIVERPAESRSPFKMFTISCLAWLDALRGFSGPEKMAYSDEVRRCILDARGGSLETLVGCPAEIFFEIGKVLTVGKEHVNGTVSMEDFRPVLDASEAYLRSWDPDRASFPTPAPEWKLLADAYRHASILRVLRFPEPLASYPADEPVIRESVAAILDVAAKMAMDSPFYKRLLFPLFLAGAETSSPHQYHYVQLCIGEIKKATGFQHQAMTDLLKKVWEVRQESPQRRRNVSWTEWTCSSALKVQHAFLFF